MTLDLGYLGRHGRVRRRVRRRPWRGQIRAARFHPWIYWATIIATTTVGTTLADFATRSRDRVRRGQLAAARPALGSLAVWYRTLGTVSVESVSTPGRRVFYWMTIMFSQTLGTALGDWTADTAGLGLAGGGDLRRAAGAVAAAYLWTRVSRTALFWAAFVLTRPLGPCSAICWTSPSPRVGSPSAVRWRRRSCWRRWCWV